MTVTFSVTYEIPVSPERIAEIEAKMAHVIATVDPPDEAERQVAMLQRLMVPEIRTTPAIQETCGDHAQWLCPRSDCGRSIASFIHGKFEEDTQCRGCAATVNRSDLPMPLDLYRMRTRRNDGVEIQSNPRT